ncbi:igE-binding protein-like [Procambarus clarkii]|uniref:igE-binding protein-like n=1 Tax=Procambarus clarkii TaxID=6728 RepID=UPI003742B4DC
MIQTDKGTNFTSKYFNQQMLDLGIHHITSSAYHPESQGALERFHQTLKQIMRKYCIGKQGRWVEDLPYLFFAIRSVPNESLGLLLFELVYGPTVHGPLEVVRYQWEEAESNMNMLDWISSHKRTTVCCLAVC